jgi:hypothetical protein
MEEKEEVDPKNIQFEYADKAAPNVNREQRVSFNGIAQDLQASLYQQLRKFQPPDTRQPDSPAI